MNKSTLKMLPIAIMAHNEEKVINKSIESVLRQIPPAGYSVKVFVVANACTDNTEKIVQQMCDRYPNKVQLISIKDKGKTRAINESIRLFGKLSSAGIIIPYVIFLDADCELMGTESFVNFVKGFDDNPLLCSIGAHCVPDVCFTFRRDIVAEIYRAVNELRKLIKINSISGMCYGIRRSILEKINFPNFQFAEDMFVSSRLNGRFSTDEKITIIFKSPANLHSEISRRTRQEINTQRYRDYYSQLKKKGKRVELFKEPLGDSYRWGIKSNPSFFRAWFELKSVKLKFYALLYLCVRLLSKINAHNKIKKIKKNKELDYWSINR